MTGAAPIYKPLLPSASQVYQMGERNRALQEERHLKAVQDQLEQQGKDLDKAFAYKPDPVMAEYQPYFSERLQGLQAKWTSLIRSQHPMAKTIIAQDQAAMNAEVGIVKDMQERINKTRLDGKDPVFNSTETNIRLARTIRDADGKLIPPSQLDPEAPLKVLEGDGIVNPVGWAQAFAKEVEGTATNEFKYVTDPSGRQFQQRWEIANKFAKMKPGDIYPEYDPKTGRIQLNITPELLSKALNTKGGQQLIREKIKEHQTAGDKNYAPADALRDILTSTGYAGGGYKRQLKDQDVLNKSELDVSKYIGGSAKEQQNYMNAADYFHKLINGDPVQKNKLLGDFQSKDWSTTYQTKLDPKEFPVKDFPPSKKGYIVVNYDPANKAALSQATALLAALSPETQKEMLRKHQFPINLDNEDRALTELSYWRNQSRNQDLNPDFLRQAYEQVKKSKPADATDNSDPLGLFTK